MGVENSKMEDRYMFDGLFICQRVLTSRFCLITKIFHQNHFSMRNNYKNSSVIIISQLKIILIRYF